MDTNIIIPKDSFSLLPEFDYESQTAFMKKLGSIPSAAIICDGKVTHVDYISVKVLEKIKAIKIV